MATQKDIYAPRPLSTSIEYPGCGLYRIEDGMPVFVILTREPGEEICFINDRMLLIMPGDYVNEWIGSDVKPKELLDAAMTKTYYEKAESKQSGTDDNTQISML